MTEKLCNKAICSDSSCTGCMACVNSCRHGAIIQKQNEKGFYRPACVPDLCVNCGLCQNVCPSLHPLEESEFKQTAYFGFNRSEKIKKKSSSGGLFSAIAESVLSKGGIVYGAMFDENMTCVISNSEAQKGIEKFRGSKYVQAKVGSDTYSEIRKKLHSNQLVLFSGTPCQVAGLKSYLGKDFDNLLTVDFLCHGVPSPLVNQKYVKYLENQRGAKITSLKHRDKYKSWRIFNFLISYSDGEQSRVFRCEDPYYQLFLRNFSVQDTCFHCQYTKPSRNSDLTLADYWIDVSNKRYFDDDQGMSLILLNSKKGMSVFKEISDGLKYQQIDFDMVKQKYGYLNIPTPKPPMWENFWKDIKAMAFTDIIKKYGYPARISTADKVIMKFGKQRWNSLLLRILYKYDYIIHHSNK